MRYLDREISMWYWLLTLYTIKIIVLSRQSLYFTVHVHLFMVLVFLKSDDTVQYKEIFFMARQDH